MRMCKICMTLCFLVSLSFFVSFYNLQAGTDIHQSEYICLSVSIYVHLSVSPGSIISSVSDSCKDPSVRLSVCLFIYISVSLSTIISGSKAYVSDSCRQVRRSIHPSVCLKPDNARCILSDISCCGPRKEKRLTTI